MREWVLRATVGVLLLASPSIGGNALQVSRPQANLRSEPNGQAGRAGVLQQGDEIELLERRGEWFRVRSPEGQEGWVQRNLVVDVLVISTATARVRAAGSPSAEVVGAANAGDVVTKRGQKGGWLEVSLPDGTTGWIASNLARPKSISLAAAARSRPAPPQRSASPAASAAASPPASSPGTDPRAPSSLADASSPDSAAVRGNAYAEGLQQAIAGDYQGALGSFEAVLVQEPQNLNALFNAAKAHRQLGQNDQALGKLYRIMALNQGRNRRDLFRELGEVYQAVGKTDSAAKYQALFRGQEWDGAAAEPTNTSLLPADSDGLRRPASRVPWIMVAAGVGAVGVLSVVLFLLLRRKSEPVDEDLDDVPPVSAPGRGRFAATMRQTAAKPPAIDRGAEEELDRQIEAKKAELRASGDAFLGGAPVGKGSKSEDQCLEELLGHLESLRAALSLQDERERVYADLVRLQAMRLEVLERQVALFRRRSRS